MIDSLAFAREGRQLEGRKPVDGFARLSSLVSGPSGEVSFSVTGERTEHGESFLLIEASGEFVLKCQRCLEPLLWPVTASGRLLLVPQGQPLPDEDLEEDDFDPIQADSALELLPLIEEEVLLALPYAPAHEKCDAPLPLGGAGKKSPFAVLESLRADKGSEN